ncbi:hypothetical protein R3P38DRAFT_1600885 [Favolaschia claudopus]|uniref:Uncharacterized protein n=1 Tax=Favolaschia claudopus TaxID=2862362 RepID=A0AAW0AI29_9AGAR
MSIQNSRLGYHAVHQLSGTKNVLHFMDSRELLAPEEARAKFGVGGYASKGWEEWDVLQQGRRAPAVNILLNYKILDFTAILTQGKHGFRIFSPSQSCRNDAASRLPRSPAFINQRHQRLIRRITY